MRKIFKISAAAVTAAVLIMLSACVPLDIIDELIGTEETEIFSAESLNLRLESDVKSRAESGEAVYSLSENPPTEDEIRDVVDNALNNNPYVYYLADSIEWKTETSADYCKLSYNIIYTENTVSPSEFKAVSSKTDATEYALDCIKNNNTKLVLEVDDSSWDEYTAKSIALAAMYNSGEEYRFDGYTYCFYPENADFRLLELDFPAAMDDDEYNSVSQELNRRLDEITEEINGENTKSKRDLLKKIHDKVVSSAEYDYSLAAKKQQDESVERSAYGCLVTGKTVCSGYSYAFKLLCDRFGIDCWTILGAQDGEGHAWNAVKLDGKKYYVDCTFDNTAKTDEYFLFTENDEQFDGYDAYDDYVIPW